ncbi:MAG: (2Fe-2S)-binding protein [Bdellovibrionaceae bacterium]|jgi:bacterioferritin-associated ferredoxin|nr:(2Fe-2S)-binding protein [Pseudobdellovibrionaceae bacterium]
MKRNNKNKTNRQDHIVCFCMQVKQSAIEEAIKDGAHNLGQIYDACGAGVGPCKGSCKPYMQNMINSYIEDGVFPEDPRPKKR